MNNTSLTGFDLLLFLSNNLMHIQKSPESDEFNFIVTDALSENLSQMVGFEVSVEVLEQILAQFGEFSAGVKIELSPNGEVK